MAYLSTKEFRNLLQECASNYIVDRCACKIKADKIKAQIDQALIDGDKEALVRLSEELQSLEYQE